MGLYIKALLYRMEISNSRKQRHMYIYLHICMYISVYL